MDKILIASIAVAVVIVAILIYIFINIGNNNNFEGFNSTDYYWPPDQVNDRSLDPHIYLQKHLNLRTDFRAKPNSLDLPYQPPQADFLHMTPYSTYKRDINPEIFQLTNRFRPNWMRANSNVFPQYGKVFYYDRRFLESAVDVEYAKDPKGYCQLYPDVYPCLNSGYSGGI
jgi:hypothetical protein